MFLSCFAFCVLILCVGVLSEAENGAIHWFRPFWTADGQCVEYEFWQETVNSPIYGWKEGWKNWRILNGFNPTPGCFALVTDTQWIAAALKNNKRQTQIQRMALQ